MGGLNNLYTFISNRVLPQNNNNSNKENLYCTNYSQPNHQRHYSDSASALAQKDQTIQQLFPCEDRHSFNPHYQHNLHIQSTSPTYSIPPSLSSSPTNSSPSSITSPTRSHPASLSQSLSTQAQKPYYQQPHPKRPLSFQQQQQQQKQTGHSRSQSLNSRQQTRRQNQRNYANYQKQQQQQHFEYMDDDLMVGYDSQHIYYGSGASTSMARVHPNGSSSYTSLSSSGSDRQHNNEPNRRTSHISYSSSHSSENERTSSPASRSLAAAASSSSKSNNNNAHYYHHRHHPQQQQQQQHRRVSYLLPSISETTVNMYLHDAEIEEEDTQVTPSPSSASSSSLVSSSSSNTPMTAKQSLMRIAQCDVRQDGWCSFQSGQWTRHYAETQSRGIITEGRRARRM